VLEVGRIVRPHGLKGQVMVELWTNRAERMAVGTELMAGGQSLLVASAARQADSGGRARWLVSFEGFSSREAAESLRDRVLMAEPIEVEGALWVHELVGSQLHQPDGVPVGRVEAVEANPASDLLLLEDGRAIPLTFVTRDSSGRLIVDGPPGLLDPA
jgi:16S rRNA processing protein RimM